MNLSAVQDIFQILLALFGAFLAALWLSLVFWTFRDLQARNQDRMLQILASLVVLVLGPLGVVIYLILRPPMTIDEVYQQTLEEEALLSEIEQRPLCPGCGQRTHEDWQVCPNCHTHLHKPCHNCGRLMELSWQLCPYCGTTVPGVRAADQEAA